MYKATAGDTPPSAGKGTQSSKLTMLIALSSTSQQEYFHIPYQHPREPYMASSLKSGNGMETIMHAKIEKKRKKGQVLGPFYQPTLLTLRVSPLGIFPKKVPGEYRLIYHLLYLHKDPVNDFIPNDLCPFKYISFDKAMQMVK